MRVATFAADQFESAGIDYSAFLDTVFSRVAVIHASRLLIDLRGNDGGRDTYGSLLLRHPVDRPVAYYRQLVARTNQLSFWAHTQLDSTANAPLRGRNAAHFERGVLTADSTTPELEPAAAAAAHFRRAGMVLIDGGTFSTAAEFCSVLRSLGRATFVGEETGGAYEGNTSGSFAILTLPNTGIRILIPLIRYELAVEPARQRGRGVLPDHGFSGPASLDDRALIMRVLRLMAG